LTQDHTHNPTAMSWVVGADTHRDFPVQNLPLGVFAPKGRQPRIGTAIGDQVLDLTALCEHGHFSTDTSDALGQSTLNALFSLPGANRLALRHKIFDLLTDKANGAALTPHLYQADDVTMHLPAHIGDYTDFYVGIHHARNIGKQFRPDNPLLPNYRHIPIGYHGRASSVRVSGTDVIRPNGQRKAPDADAPEFGPCRRLDYELELGVWVCGENSLGQRVDISNAWERMAGLTLLNDWSARDIQAWEYQPLGPFLAKNFLTSVSPWVITSEALAPFRIAQPSRPAGDPKPLPYLWDEGDQATGGLAIELSVALSTAQMRANNLPPVTISTGSSSNMYWTIAQMIAHHTSGGCDLRPGDLLGTGTISSEDPGGYGSLMEISVGGTQPLRLPSGETRNFLEDGDEVTMTAHARTDAARSIGFGTCIGRVVSAA
jgi:fumarylacetoacetase